MFDVETERDIRGINVTLYRRRMRSVGGEMLRLNVVAHAQGCTKVTTGETQSTVFSRSTVVYERFKGFRDELRAHAKGHFENQQLVNLKTV